MVARANMQPVQYWQRCFGSNMPQGVPPQAMPQNWVDPRSLTRSAREERRREFMADETSTTAAQRPEASASTTSPTSSPATSNDRPSGGAQPSTGVASTGGDRPAGDRPAGDRPHGGDRPSGGSGGRGPGGPGGRGPGGPGGPGGRGPGGPGGRKFFRRKKVCKFCVEKIDSIHYRDVRLLQGFVAERGKIVPRRLTGVCTKHQRRLTRAIKQARNIALLPFAARY
jgi:small subunit ribosomal protein S18